jgi:hypothetical protein
MKQLARYWERTRESGDPKVSPAIDALNEILYMGRQVRMHVLLVAQSATARALGGPEVREQFATRFLARYSMNAWRMLAPEIHPAPKSTKHVGRAQVVIGGTARETQVLFFTDAEAREWSPPARPPPRRRAPLPQPNPPPYRSTRPPTTRHRHGGRRATDPAHWPGDSRTRHSPRCPGPGRRPGRHRRRGDVADEPGPAADPRPPVGGRTGRPRTRSCYRSRPA